MKGIRMKGLAAGAAAGLLIVGLAACGGDDDEGTADTTEGTAPEGEGVDTEAFCSSLVEFNGAVLQVELDESSSEDDVKAVGEQLGPVFQEITDNAPEAVADQAAELNEAVQALAEGDAEAFNADETFEAYGTFVNDSVAECGFEQVDVEAVDYAFEGVPETIPAGTVSFALTNSSEEEEHEMILLKKADGVTESFEDIIALPEEEAMSKVEFTAAAFAPPGGESATLAEVSPGEYAMVCFIPVGGAEDGPPHFTAGMIQEVTVE